MLEVSTCMPARMHENACATRQCIVNNAVVDVTPHLFQFLSVVHPRLVHSLLGDAPDPVINRIKVRAVCWPKIRWNERRRCSRSRTVSRAGVLGRCPVERLKIPLIPRASRGVAVLAIVSAIDLNAQVNEDEVCAAQLRYADRRYKGLTERGSSAQRCSRATSFFVVVNRLLFAKNI